MRFVQDQSRTRTLSASRDLFGHEMVGICGRHLLAAKLRAAERRCVSRRVDEVERIVAKIRPRWPPVTILLRADSMFARDELIACCEANAVEYLFVPSRN